MTRGYKNNNPGNLRISSSAWVGKVPVAQNTDKAFEQFVSLKYGIRALILNVRGAITRGQNTLQKLISAYAPASENNTAAYINAVAKESGLAPSQAIPDNKEVLAKIIVAITRMENGSPVSLSQFEEAWNALGETAADVKKKQP